MNVLTGSLLIPGAFLILGLISKRMPDPITIGFIWCFGFCVILFYELVERDLTRYRRTEQ